MENFVVAITRTCGSGGTTVGKMLAEHCGVNFYGRELLRMASEDSGISEALFIKADEGMRHSLLFRISKKVYADNVIPPEGDAADFVSNDNLFNYQAKVLKELAQNEAYVVVGRAAAFVLREHPRLISIFLYASPQFCLEHIIKKFGLPPEEAKKYIKKNDRYRSEYNRYYTGQDWQNPKSYDLCINTGSLGFENTALLIHDYLNKRK